MKALLFAVLVTTATATVKSATRAEKNAYVNAHNAVRDQEDACPSLPDVKWDSGIQKVAEQVIWPFCQSNTPWGHSSTSFRSKNPDAPSYRYLGENLGMAWTSSSKEPTVSPANFVMPWYNEKSDYTFGKGGIGSSGSCTPGTMCGHYTQVVWKNSVNIGCAHCTVQKNGAWYTYSGCNYGEGGNYYGNEPYATCSKSKLSLAVGENSTDIFTDSKPGVIVEMPDVDSESSGGGGVNVVHLVVGILGGLFGGFALAAVGAVVIVSKKRGGAATAAPATCDYIPIEQLTKQ